MTPGKAGGLFGERLGNCSLRCSRQLLLHCSTFAHPWARPSSTVAPGTVLPPPSLESCIHAVVKGADQTVRRLPGGGCCSPSPFQGEGWDGGGMLGVRSDPTPSVHDPTHPPPPPARDEAA